MQLLLLVIALVHAPIGTSPSPNLTPGADGIIHCATPRVSSAEAAEVQSRIRGRGLRSGASFRLEIPIAFHVITCKGEGDVNQSQIDAQVREMNSAYRSTGFSFSLASVDRTENCSWFSKLTSPGTEKKMKQALAIDPAHRLNVYTADLGRGLIGWAYFPQSVAEDSYWHGVVLHYGTLPGGSLAPYNEGGTLDHETGHYLGLYHTFENGCSEPGDYVDDTPFEASPAIGCPIGRNTCPQPGDDPIHNYMDYTTDACYSEFTPDQAARMQSITRTYRPGLFGGALALAGRSSADAATPVTEANAALARPVLIASARSISGTTTFRFALPRAGQTRVELFDVSGRRIATVADGPRPAGEQALSYRAESLNAGVYFVVLRLDSEPLARTLLIVK